MMCKHSNHPWVRIKRRWWGPISSVSAGNNQTEPLLSDHSEMASRSISQKDLVKDPDKEIQPDSENKALKRKIHILLAICGALAILVVVFFILYMKQTKADHGAGSGQGTNKDKQTEDKSKGICCRGSPRKKLNLPWAYVCKNDKCVKTEAALTRETQINTCKLTCGKYGPLWPRPTARVLLGKKTVTLLPWNIYLVNNVVPNIRILLNKAFEKFKGSVRAECSAQAAKQFCPASTDKYKLQVSVTITSGNTSLTLETNEAYSMKLSTQGTVIKANIQARTFFGARHGLETLSQLISYDETTNALQMISDAEISDSPKFKYRGVLLDTSRNFYSVKRILRLLDGMAHSKLNTFHWHITDTHSFPIYTPSQPNMTKYGAYSSKQIYTPDNVREIVEYARIRGIRVMPEFDMPAHCGNGWQWGKKAGKGDLAFCVNQEPWNEYCLEPPCGQLNPINNHTYEVLFNIFKDYLGMFESELFHVGGDEVHINCWNTSNEIIQYLAKKGKSRTEEDFLDLMGDFLDRAVKKLTEANKGKEKLLMIWSSSITEEKHLGKYIDKDKYIIQYWDTATNTMIKDIVNKGFRIVFSNYDRLYLDCGFSNWVTDGNNWCSPYKGWQLFYDNNPFVILKNLNVTLNDSGKMDLVLGGESAMWSEQVDDVAVEMKIWPRAAALAERLWSNPKSTWREAEARMLHHRQRLIQRGLQPDALQPEWCYQNEGHCRI